MASRLSWKAWLTALVSLAAIPALMAGRGYPWQLAMAAAAAIGVLVYMTASTVEKARKGSGTRSFRRHEEGED